MEDTNSYSSSSSITLANTWAGRTVTIRGRGGSIYIDPPLLKEHPTTVKTNTRGKAILLAIEDAPSSLGLPGAVAFRVVGSMGNLNTHNTITSNDENMYLTNVMYGDEERQSTAEALASIPSLLSVHIPLVVDYCIGRPTGEANFEGAGFNYSPMTVQRGGGGQQRGCNSCDEKEDNSGGGNGGSTSATSITCSNPNTNMPLLQPNKLQVFELTALDHYQSNRFGIKSVFGTYWRSQHWNNTVSQSPHLLGDETWHFSVQEEK